MARFLDKTRRDPLAQHVRVAVLRSLKRAMYATGKSGHYGLAKTDYAHFTSPIRRYPDLEVHRQLAAVLAGKPTLQAEHLGVVAAHCTQTEWKADEAERAVVEIKKFRYLEQEIRRGADIEFDGVVVRVTNFGLFVELNDLQLTGLVHISTISERLVTFDPSRAALRAGRRVFKVGQKVRVRVSKVDFNARRVDFLLV